VSAARSVRELVREWRAAVPGRTILLTSHYMAEVDELCDRLAIVDRGRILAIGTPDELKHRVQGGSIFRLEVDQLDAGTATLAGLPGVESATLAAAEDDPERQTVVIDLQLADDAVLGEVISMLAAQDAHLVSLQKREPTLEDVFVELVGRGFSGDATQDDR
jgi:ABC-2 type transport system ATP-binding protein